MKDIPDILHSCIAGDRKAQKEFYDHYSREMFSICLRYSVVYEDAEDCLQIGFVKAFKYLDQYRFEGSFEGWLKRIFVNTTLEVYRQRRLHQNFEIQDVFYSKESTGFDNLALSDLYKIIDSLSDSRRNIIKLYLEGYSHVEIGNLMNIEVSTSKSQVTRTKKQLRNILLNKKPTVETIG